MKRDWNWFERFIGCGSDDHHQTYHAWRQYPKAIKLAMLVGFNLGLVLTSWIWFLAYNWSKF